MFDEEREEERINALPAHLREEWQPDGMSAPPESPEKRPFTYYGQRVPVEAMRSLMRYLVSGIQPGSFLTAVLQNDLMTAVLRADPLNLAALPVICAYVYQEIPSAAWGSPMKVKAWILKHSLDSSP